MRARVFGALRAQAWRNLSLTAFPIGAMLRGNLRPEHNTVVIPAKAGIHIALHGEWQKKLDQMDSRFRGNDDFFW